MHSAPSSVQSLHFGLVPSHRDLRERHTSHCRPGQHITTPTRYRPEPAICTYSDRGSSPRVVDFGRRVPPLQRIDAAIVALPVLHSVRKRVRSIIGRLRQISSLLGRPKNPFSAKALSPGGFERCRRFQWISPIHCVQLRRRYFNGKPFSARYRIPRRWL